MPRKRDEEATIQKGDGNQKKALATKTTTTTKTPTIIRLLWALFNPLVLL